MASDSAAKELIGFAKNRLNKVYLLTIFKTMSQVFRSIVLTCGPELMYYRHSRNAHSNN